MSITFHLPNRDSAPDAMVRYGAGYASTALTIRGSFYAQGPQVVGPDGVPQEVADIFARMPSVFEIALNTPTSGAVYTYPGRERPPEKEPFFTEEEVRGYFAYHCIKIHKMWELTNSYFRRNDVKGPWWLVKVNAGLAEIGWRKRVIHIEWSECPEVRKVVTDRNVTKGDDHVHAYSVDEVIQYLGVLRTHLNKVPGSTPQWETS